jgi:2'-hydroxyisoflavone reductase
MKLLVLGGTVFLGRHVVDAALAAGHEVTLFNRGRRQLVWPRDVEQLIGDRNGDLAALRGRHWEAVIDCSGYTPAQLAASGEVLRDAVAHYVFVSSVSVYASFPPGQRYDESAAVASGDDGYGPQKARAEEAIEAAMPGRVSQVRPGLIVGPHDPTGRFTYWPSRIARGGLVLAPGRSDRPVQVIDVRDLAAWCVALADRRVAGVFNAVGDPLTMGELLADCVAQVASACVPGASSAAGTRLVWLGDDDLLAAGVEPWSGLPLWLPESDAEFGGMLLGDHSRAVAAGLQLRPLRDTIAATLQWLADDPAALPAGPSTLSADREAELLSQHRSAG